MSNPIKNTIDESLYSEVKSIILNESKMDFIIGKPLSFIRRLHTTKYNQETGELDPIQKDMVINGTVEQLIDDDPSAVPTMVVKYDGGNVHIMYERGKKRFIEGESSFLYEYIPTTEKDKKLFELFTINFYDDNESGNLNESEGDGYEVFHITCEGEPVDTFETEEIAMKHLDIYKKKHPEKEFLIEKKRYNSPSEMINKLDEMSGDEEKINENKKMKKVKVSSLAEAALMAKQKNTNKFKFNGKEYKLNEYWKSLEEDEMCEQCKYEKDIDEEKESCNECGGMLNEEGMCNECGTGKIKESKKTKLRLTESELVSLIEKMVKKSKVKINESKDEKIELFYVMNSKDQVKNISKKESDAERFLDKSLKGEGKIKSKTVYKKDYDNEKVTVSTIKNYTLNESVPGLNITKTAQSASKKENDSNIKDVEEKLKKISTFDGNDNPEFPKQIGKGEKMAINNTEKQDEIVADNRGGGMEDLKYDYEPSEKFKKRLKMALEGDSTMGNSQDAANVIKTKTGENTLKKSERKKEKEENDFNVSWGHKWKSPVDIKESKKLNTSSIIEEEIQKMKRIIGYDEKTQ
jgi:hypothetical protein